MELEDVAEEDSAFKLLKDVVRREVSFTYI
jgi:hypothetical protein